MELYDMLTALDCDWLALLIWAIAGAVAAAVTVVGVGFATETEIS